MTPFDTANPEAVVNRHAVVGDGMMGQVVQELLNFLLVERMSSNPRPDFGVQATVVTQIAFGIVELPAIHL